MNTKSFDDYHTSASRLLSALSNEKRLQIVQRLTEGEISVGMLAKEFNLSQSALSQHLAKLRNAKVVSFRREAQMIYYSCSSIAAIKILMTLEDFFGTLA